MERAEKVQARYFTKNVDEPLELTGINESRCPRSWTAIVNDRLLHQSNATRNATEKNPEPLFFVPGLIPSNRSADDLVGRNFRQSDAFKHCRDLPRAVPLLEAQSVLGETSVSRFDALRDVNPAHRSLTIDHLAHDRMQQRCHELYRVIDAQVKAGKRTEVILAFCSKIRRTNEFILSQVEGMIEHLRREEENSLLVSSYEM